MQEDLNWSATLGEGGKFDDEITLPLRIICERKSEAGANPREEQKTKDVREREHRLVRAS